MDWIVHTPALRHLHMGLAFTSGALFAVRGAALLNGQRWALHPLLSRASIIIDTALLSAALRLLWLLHLNPLAAAWLQAKLAALLVYIALGLCTFKYVRKRRPKTWCYWAALACYGYIVSVAITRTPWGLLAPLRG